MTNMNEMELLDRTIRKVLYWLGTMTRAETESFIEFGRKASGTYKDNILKNAFINKYLEPFEEMDAEKQQAFMYALMFLHGRCRFEVEMEMKNSQP